MSLIETPVLIVGGSLVGLSMAMNLGHHGVHPLVVEHHHGTAIHPRAAQISQRTMEIFRKVGVEHVVLDKSDKQFVQDGAIMAVETLAGRELEWFVKNLNEGVRDVSPTERVFISQSMLEPLLKARSKQLGARLRFGTDMTGFEQDEDGVTATIQDRESGNTETVHAKYMIAADGAHSRVRDQLGIGVSGHGVFSNSVTIYFRGDVAPLLGDRNLSVIYVNNPTLRGFFRFEKPFDSGFLAINALGDPDHPETDVSTGLTEEKCIEYVHNALGSDEVEVTIDNIMPWKAAAEVADRFRAGRVFLAGDSAHVMPPNGGFGGNTGVQDAHNLAWKLAMVLDGKAGEALLATYEVERRPTAEFTVEQAYSRYVTRTAPYLANKDGNKDLQTVEDDLNVELGYSYQSEGVISDVGAPSISHENPRDSKGRPGTRAPHYWLHQDGHPISTLDLYGHHFVLQAGSEGIVWYESAREISIEMDVHIDIYEIGMDGLKDPEGGFSEAYGITPGGALLIRPDGFVGWRSGPNEEASPDTLRRALTQLICRQTLLPTK